MTSRRRADVLLVEHGLFESRNQARSAITAGLVTADSRTVRKPSEEVAVGAVLQAGAGAPFVSRGGVKLAAALDQFGFHPTDRVCLDVGASTGGFTDVLLSRSARRVYAVDVGRGQLHPRLRSNPRVVALEQTDIRALGPDSLPELSDFIVIDVSFISLTLALPPALCLAQTPARLIALIKPQFEAGRGSTKKGIVRDLAVHRAVCARIAALVEAHEWRVAGIIASPLPGGAGNREFLLGAQRD